LRHWFKGAAEKAKIKDFVWRDLQHCSATMLPMKDAKLEDIGERLGHKSLTMAKCYRHLEPNQLHSVSPLLDACSAVVAPETTLEATVSTSYLN